MSKDSLVEGSTPFDSAEYLTPNPETGEGNNFTDLVAFTTTHYQQGPSSLVKQELALKMLNNAHRLGLKIVVLDRNSNPDFLQKAQELDNVSLVEEPHGIGMGEGRREALKIAAEAIKSSGEHFFLWLEPEKDDLISAENLTKLLTPLRNHQTDIVVPARTNKSTMPRFQAWIESRANERAMATLGENSPVDEVWDFWFGPKVFNEVGAQYFLNYRGGLDKWDSVIKPVANAFKDGRKIVSVPVDFKYDVSQKNHEEESRELKRKRLEQYAEILAELGDKLWGQETLK